MEPVSFCIDGESIKVSRCNRVYFPSEDTFLLLETLSPEGKCLEIGSGSGLISIVLARKGYSTIASDINPDAVECTELNSSLNDVKVEVLLSDLFDGINGSFDTIIFNPPYLPGDGEEEEIEESEMWYGGEDGLTVIRKFLAGLPEHLNRGGRCYMILSSLTDIDGLKREFNTYSFEVLGERSFFMEKIFAYSLSLI